MSRLYTVPPGVPFLKALASGLLSGGLPWPGHEAIEPLSLPRVTLLLPTRRAARAAQEAFLSVSGRRALLMPRIRPISEGEEDLSLLQSLAEIGPRGQDALDMPPAVSALARTLTLMQLVLRWRNVMARAGERGLAPEANNTPAQAAQLAAELGKLMDDVERENVSLDDLQDLVPDTYSEHWQQTVDFLKIVTQFWPEILKQNGLVSREARRNALILAEAQRIAADRSDDPIIVAGVTGSIPATVELMRAVASHPAGAIVLPGLDTVLDEASWQRIVPDHPEHPQYGLKKLLDALGVARSSVAVLPGSASDADMAQRASLISEAMRPSADTDAWHTFVETADREALARALRRVSLIAAPSAHDEAEAVALILREAVEHPGRTAALVSPDRLLARRVAIRLEAWGIRVDDSAGRPFAKTVPGTLLTLVIDAVVNDFAPAQTMALLKHPLTRLGLAAFDIRRFSRALELIAFRTAYLGRGLDGIGAALDKAELDRLASKRQHRASRRLWDEDRAGAADLVARLKAAFAPLTELYAASGEQALKAFAAAHVSAAEAVAQLPADEAADAHGQASSALWQGEAGETASRFFTELADAATPDLELAAAGYADLYAALLSRENVRERTAVHPRVSIWGPFEARLQQPDILVLGSLNEGTWPENADPGAWLNRPMRRALKLPSPEEEIGRAAHDFTAFLAAPIVYMTRAEKVNGVPTVPSRWLMRLSALLDGMELQTALEPDRPWLAWARARDAIDESRRVRMTAPEPRPPIDLRPKQLSVSSIEDWIANPYAVFARKILRLEPLPVLGASPDASLRGGLVHEVLSRFAMEHPTALPANMDEVLHAIARDVLQSYTGHPRVAAFWLPRLHRFLVWFSHTEDERREHTKRIIAETSGALVLPGLARPFTVTARADRIDDDGAALVITDYKTGTLPADKAVLTGRSPQLPLEAAIALGPSGFPELAGRGVKALRYIRASGGEPPGEERLIKTPDAAALADAALAGLYELVSTFNDEATPYRAIRRPRYSYDYDDFAHLARVAEWSAHVPDEVVP